MGAAGQEVHRIVFLDHGVSLGAYLFIILIRFRRFEIHVIRCPEKRAQ